MTTAWPRSQRSAAPQTALDARPPARRRRPYVAAAYLVFLALILVYVAIMATKLVRIEREISELSEIVERREAERAPEEERV